MSERGKVTEQHRRRRAVVYVRQSTLAPGRAQRGVLAPGSTRSGSGRSSWAGRPGRCRSSTRTRAGRAARRDGRIGFKELVAEVGLGHVGLVLALEVSRFARSSADWHQLLDLCALTGTLIADADGVYSPADFNDRLLLGLKGTMSEAELHLIRARLDGGLRNKAERGELRLALPVGLDRDEDDRIVLCPDEQVRHAIERVFVLWRRVGSARQVVMELIDEGQQLPRRTVGQRRIRWARASYGAVHDFLTNPAYAGAFVFGRTRREKTVDRDGRVRVRDVEVPLEEWSVCLPEHHPGYVSWTEYLATRERLRQNVRPRGEGGGAAREGAALLQGLVRCGRCGRRMQVGYSGTGGKVRRYLCVRGHVLHHTAASCQSLGGGRLEKAVVARSSRPSPQPAWPRPPARSASSRTSTSSCSPASASRWSAPSMRPSAPSGSSTRASRRTGSSPARLERKLEDALAAVERERGKLIALEHARPQPLTDAERHALARIARDLPRLWAADTTTDRDRKQLLRTLIARDRRDRPRRATTGGRRDRMGRRRSHRADRQAQRARARPPPARRGRDRADPPPRRAPPRRSDRRDPQPPRPPHRQRPPVHRSHASKAARQRAGIPAAPPPDPAVEPRHHPTSRHRARRLAVHDPPLAARRTAPRRADHPERAMANPAHRRGPRTVRARRPRRVRDARTTPPDCSAAPARPCCTRSNAENCAPSTSPADSEKA